MIQRHRRYPELFPHDKARLLAALRDCRKAIIDAGIKLDPWSRTYQLGGPVTKAIDELAGELTGDPKHFHIGSATR
jgi:hypothetical protein